MQLRIDLHTHSKYSCDAKATIDEMCQAAVNKGMTCICFTEHIDFNPKDDGYGYYRHDDYTNAIRHAQDKFAERLTILQGIEFGEPHLYPNEFESMMKHDFDFVLGSVHWINDEWVGDKKFQAAHSIQEIYEMYYREVQRMVEFGGFDAIAHIDFPKRYLLAKYEPIDLIDEIIKQVVKCGIVLEINSSPLRKGFSELYPSDTIFDSYAKCGGTQATVGSDAHSGEELACDFDHVAEKIEQYKLKPVVFVKRKSVAI